MISSQSSKKSLQSATRAVLMSAKVLGVFPVFGLFLGPEKLRYRLKSPYTVLCVISVAAQAYPTMLYLIYVARNGITLRSSYKLWIQASGLLCGLNILRLSKQWPEVVRRATRIEENLLRSSHKDIGQWCKVMAAVMFTGAMVDFFLGVNFYVRMADACFDGKSFAESFYKYTMPAPAAIMPFSSWTFYPMMIALIQTILLTQFSDIIIVVISIYLASHFQDLYDLTNIYKDKMPSMWHVLRGHHSNLIRLVKLLDDTVCPFVLFSFGSNLTLMCLQLYKILKKESSHAITDICDREKLKIILAGSDRAAYYISSELLIILRTLTSALFAARVHLAAQAPLSLLYEVPSHCFNAETRRFIEQIGSTKVALSGYHFFYVTRGMVITMTAAVITYELVLLQFA